MGAALAGLIGTALVNSLRLVEVFVLLGCFPYSPSYLKPIAAGLLGLAASLASAPLLAGQPGLVQLAGQSAVLVIAYGCLIFALGVEPEDRMLLARLLRRVKVVLAR
jgi:hypothetical protein